MYNFIKITKSEIKSDAGYMKFNTSLIEDGNT